MEKLEKKFCKDCKQYSRQTKKCREKRVERKYVPRKGTCQYWGEEK